MWKKSGLNLDAHNALLDTLGKGYTDIYFFQKDRPRAWNILIL